MISNYETEIQNWVLNKSKLKIITYNTYKNIKIWMQLIGSHTSIWGCTFGWLHLVKILAIIKDDPVRMSYEKLIGKHKALIAS